MGISKSYAHERLGEQLCFFLPEKSFRPGRPLDPCLLLILRPLWNEKVYPLNIPHSRESFGAEYLSVGRKVTASRFEKHRVTLHQDITVAPCTHDLFLTWRATSWEPDTPSHAAAAFLSNIDLSMWGRMCSLSLPVPLFLRQKHIEDALTERNEISSRIGAHVECKKEQGFEIPFPILQDSSRVSFRRETWRRYYCLYTALDYRWNM